MRKLMRVPFVALLLIAGGPGPIGSVVHRPRIPVEAPRGAGWASSNWSGYALSGSGYGAITGEWIVQAVVPSSRPSYSSQWVGIDGFNNSSLIQTGTESDYYNGSAHYRAWWEILPAAETVIRGINVLPGHRMMASITHDTGNTWTIFIMDTSTGQQFTTIQTYTGPQTSAEWIEEAPTVGGRVATLANYGLATFDPGTVNGGNPMLADADRGVMIQKRVHVSTPSVADDDTDGFNMQFGSSTPAPPAT